MVTGFKRGCTRPTEWGRTSGQRSDRGGWVALIHRHIRTHATATLILGCWPLIVAQGLVVLLIDRLGTEPIMKDLVRPRLALPPSPTKSKAGLAKVESTPPVAVKR